MSDGACEQQRYRKTCRRYNEPGHAHALTFSCYRRRPFLSRDRSCRWFLESLGAVREKHCLAVWAYVLMPEHVHLVIYPEGNDYSISSILTDLKKPVTHRAVEFLREHAPSFLHKMRDEQPNGKVTYRFWQRGGGYDRNLIKPEIIRATIDYIHANPVRRGLVDSPDKWAWSSARYFAGRDDVLLVPDVENIPPIAQR